MTWFEIRPRDVWLFRDGRPFNAGEDNSAQSVFPPSPLTVQGALRQKISESHGVSYSDYIAEKKKPNVDEVDSFIGSYQAQKIALDTGGFRLKGPFIALSTKNELIPLLPCPADLLFNQQDAVIVNPSCETLRSDLGGYSFVAVREGYENKPTHWMTSEAFKNYLGDKFGKALIARRLDDLEKDKYDALEAISKDGMQVIHHELIYRNEGRFGVATDSTTSFREEGQLYQAKFIRPTKNIALLAQVTGSAPSKYLEGQMILGGEQRHAQNTVVNPDFDFLKPDETLGELFKIIFVTPAYFKQGWLPTNADWSQWFGENVELVSAVLYRPQAIGGWNSATGKAGAQRRMHNYVAAGSVYYFKGLAKKPLPEAITESPNEIKNASALGFGQVAYGRWSYSD